MSEQVGSYRLLEEIESEGLIALHDASDPLTGRELRVQVIRVPEDLREDVLPLFEQEATVAAQLSHPCIVSIVDHGIEAGSPYVVFERSDAITLVELRRRAGGRLDPQSAAIIALDVAKALEHSHAFRPPILHRGIAPPQIRIDSDGHARLGGHAITALLARVSAVYSQVLELVAQYQSPELLKGREVTPAADMFSLGATFYELLAGQSAFDAPSPLAATLKISMGSFERLDRTAPEVPADLRDLVHALLSVQPAARPTAADLVSELTSFVGRSEQRRQALGQIVRPAPIPSSPAAPVVPAVSTPRPFDDDALGGLEEPTDPRGLDSGLAMGPIAEPPPALRAPVRALPMDGGLIEGADDSPTKEVALPEPYPVGRSPSPEDLVAFDFVEEERTTVESDGIEKTVQIHAPQARALLDSLPSSAPVDETAWMEKTVQIVTPPTGSERLPAPEQPTAPPRHLPRLSLPDIHVGPLVAPAPPAAPAQAPPPPRRAGFDPSIVFFVALGFGAVGLVVVVALITAWLASS